MIKLTVVKCFERDEKEWYDVRMESVQAPTRMEWWGRVRWAGITTTEKQAQAWAESMVASFPKHFVVAEETDTVEF